VAAHGSIDRARGVAAAYAGRGDLVTGGQERRFWRVRPAMEAWPAGRMWWRISGQMACAG